MQTTADYSCAFCGEVSTTFVDISAGLSQSYVEDCQVCCQPNILYVQIDEDTLEVSIETEPESD
ncbi:MAG: CPXCG motif-containing cysteine-rich protein [Oscillatoriales cyanobacterium]|nr:MAG: CPXCG motif-containing cysteine-rich protein [Oscillatoriales cyanobacterium]